jgi:hypothetical protein
MDRVFVFGGVLFIVCALLVGVFKLYWLMAGVNTMSKKELAKYDLEFVGKWFGIIFGTSGAIMLLSSFLVGYLNMKYEYRALIFMIEVLSTCVFLFLWIYVIKRDRTYKKK